MAGNKFQIKRTGIPGRLPNTTDSGNNAFIDVGELAFNFSDGILYSSDGNNAIEIGANVTNQNITGTLAANGTVGTDGQVLTSNGSGIYWSEAEGIAQIETDDSLFGDGSEQSPLGINFSTINIGTRISFGTGTSSVDAKITRFLTAALRVESETLRNPNAIIFTRNETIGVPIN